ncbi:DUF4132 domain-containing protein [Streptomyces sp. NPDC003247]|uniref:DUF4132 domain-containing protein n=1 Tax=Streptomyces sp. NPDC003247 TaxID=3364677 RepID=UPI00369283AC
MARGIEETLSAERRRLYALRDENRLWPHAEWARYCLDHPLTGILVRSLVWEYEADEGTWTAGLPHRAGSLTLDGRTADAAAITRVRLWHPDRSTPGQVAAVRALLTGHHVHQPCDRTGEVL